MAATMKDIARVTGLGLATISSYINGGNVREKNRIAIEKAIKELGFEVNEAARALKTRKSRIIGIVIPELNNLFCTTIISSVEDILRARGYAVIVCDCRSDEKLEKEAIDFLLRKQADGIINMPVTKSGRHLKNIIKKNIPLILIDRKLDDISCDCVVVDNAGAAEKAVEYLIENGHRKIGMLSGNKDIYTARERISGYCSALEKHGIALNEDLIACGEYTIEKGAEEMRELLFKNPDMTAVFVSNYEMTIGSIIALNESGKKIPDDISVIGFDGMELALAVTPRLSFVAQPLEEIARQTAHLMLEHLENGIGGKHTVVLDTVFTNGKSVKSIK